MRSLFIGRWQPFHDGHKALIQSRLEAGDKIIVGIRDTEISVENPYSVYQRAVMIQDWNPDIEVCVVPDFDNLCYGRQVGYNIEQISLDAKTEGISGTGIRNFRRIVWLTGNSGAGKTTIAKLIAPKLRAIILDGDEMRDSISLGAGFSPKDRLEHNLRVARLAKELVKQTNVIVSVIAPTPDIRAAVEEIIKPQWVYVHRTLSWGSERPYYPPTKQECTNLITVNHDVLDAEGSAKLLMELL